MVSMWRARVVAVVLAALTPLAAGCGGTSRRAAPHPAHAARPPSTTTPTPGPNIDPAILPPRRIPRHATGPADPAARKVIRGWLRALRHGDIARAVRYFAIPSRFQNGTPVLTLDQKVEVYAVNVGFPCGAVATRYGSAGRFTLVRFKLTERTGGDCRGAAGNTTGGAIRVAGGRIREWYRLYDREETGPPPASIDAGSQEA
jgi:hypothetical protein